MSSKQGDSPNRINVKRLCLYALYVAAGMVLSYLESLLPLHFIAPGVKIGLSNALSLMLAARGDFKGAFAVNTARILLSALLFGSAVSLVFALSGGVASLAAVCLLAGTKRFSAVGMSVAGGVVHNLAQLAAAAVIIGRGVIYYAPVLVIAGAVCGAAVGALDTVILKKIKTNHNF